MKPKRILIVDDEPTWLHFLDIILTDEGYRTVRASNGVEALDQFTKMRSCDAVVTDTNMPRMHGVELLLSIRARHPGLPVVMFFSGLAGSSLNEKHILALGANAVLDKDNSSELLPLLRKLLSPPKKR